MVAGTAEPEYGAEAFHSVAETIPSNPSATLEPDDLKWLALEYTNVETQTFYAITDSGHWASIQVIYSNVMAVNISLQFLCKVFRPDGTLAWSSTQLVNHGFSDDKLEVYADNMLCSYDKDDNGVESFIVKSIADKDVAVDVKVVRDGPGVKIGNSKSLYGSNKDAPWGFMRHVFWPRCKISGSVVISNGEEREKIDMSGRALFVMACQGMKPHHAGEFAYLLHVLL